MEKLESASNCALDWFYGNGMKPNSSKCHLLICGHKFEVMQNWHFSSNRNSLC